MTKEARQKMAESLAIAAMEKRAQSALDVLVERFMSLPSEARNAIIGALAGGAFTGGVSAMTGNSAIRDSILGALLGGTAAGGGTAAFNFLTDNSRIPSQNLSQQQIQAINKAIPQDLVDKVPAKFENLMHTGAAGAGAGMLLKRRFNLERSLADIAGKAGENLGNFGDAFKNVHKVEAYDLFRKATKNPFRPSVGDTRSLFSRVVDKIRPMRYVDKNLTDAVRTRLDNDFPGKVTRQVADNIRRSAGSHHGFLKSIARNKGIGGAGLAGAGVSIGANLLLDSLLGGG